MSSDDNKTSSDDETVVYIRSPRGRPYRQQRSPLVKPSQQSEALLLVARTQNILNHISEVSASIIASEESKRENMMSLVLSIMQIAETRLHSLRLVLMQHAKRKETLQAYEHIAQLKEQRNIILQQLKDLGCQVYVRDEDDKAETECMF